MSCRNVIDGFYVIPIKKFECVYHISKDCNIIKRDPNTGVLSKSYTWNPKTANKIMIFNIRGTNYRFSPIQMFLLTFCGYCDSEIVKDNAKLNGDDPADYNYSIKDIKSNNGVIFIGNTEFRKSMILEDVYVSKNGCIFDLFRNKIPFIVMKDQYYNYRKYKDYPVAQLVYDAWVGNYDPEKEIHHKDDCEWNNDYTNLQQLTRKEHLEIHGFNYYSEDLIRQICQTMQDEDLQAYEAAKRFNVNREFVYELRAGISHRDISKDYTFSPAKRFITNKLSEDDVNEICKLFEKRELNNQQISEIFGVNKYTIQDIRKCSSWIRISNKYNYVRESDLGSREKADSVPYNKRNATITEDQVKEVWKCLQNNIKMTKIPELTGVNYGIVKKIKYRTRWTSVTDKLGPIPGDQNFR